MQATEVFEQLEEGFIRRKVKRSVRQKYDSY